MTDTFTLFWRDGKRETVRGMNAADAMMRAGYAGGALRALDFWARGDNDEYLWDAKSRTWGMKPFTERAEEDR